MQWRKLVTVEVWLGLGRVECCIGWYDSSILVQIDHIPFLDAGVVGWNLRDRKLQGSPMTFIREKVRFRCLAWRRR